MAVNLLPWIVLGGLALLALRKDDAAPAQPPSPTAASKFAPCFDANLSAQERAEVEKFFIDNEPFGTEHLTVLRFRATQASQANHPKLSACYNELADFVEQDLVFRRG